VTRVSSFGLCEALALAYLETRKRRLGPVQKATLQARKEEAPRSNVEWKRLEQDPRPGTGMPEVSQNETGRVNGRS